jgi:hypothetical protein
MDLHVRDIVASLSILAGLSLTAASQAQPPRSGTGWPCGGNVDSSYLRAAEATGGKMWLLQPSELAGSVADASASRAHEETVFRAAGELAQGEHEFSVPLDSTVESAHFFVSVQCLDRVSIILPSGDELPSDRAGVEPRLFGAVHLYTVGAPDPGAWKVRVAGRGLFSVIVEARSALALVDVTFLEGDVPLDAPRAGVQQRIEARVRGAAEEVAFQIVTLDASLIEWLDLSLKEEMKEEEGADFDRTYAGEVTPTGGEFRVSLTGRDTNGFRFQRVLGRLLTPR